MNKLHRIISIMLILVVVGCAGTKPFNHTARAGDTIMIAAGWKHQFARDKLTVTFTPPVGNDIVYLPGDNRVRASINLYTDPVSFVAVGYENNMTGAYSNARTYGSVISNNFTDKDPDWWQTAVYVDLPTTLPVGTTQVVLSSSGTLGEIWAVPVEVIAGIGTAHDFSVENSGTIQNYQLQTLERAPNYEVQFSGATTPYAIQIDLTHDPDMEDPTNPGYWLKKARVISPRGDVKSINWSDDG